MSAVEMETVVGMKAVGKENRDVFIRKLAKK